MIVARRKSKRLPGKVLRPLLGHPLIAWMVSTATASSLERVIVSTEDAEIAEIARAYGAETPFLRPVALADDFAEDKDILLHAVNSVEQDGKNYPYVVLMQATTPFLAASDIDRCLFMLDNTDAGCAFTARRVTEPPEWMFTVQQSMLAQAFVSGVLEKERQHAQNLPGYYLPNGGAYAIRTKCLRSQNRIYCDPLYVVETPQERSVDIDDEIGLAVAEIVGKKRGFDLATTDRL